MNSKQLVLASQSPRRVELLTQIGLTFIQKPADIDETPAAGEAPLDYVVRMAKEKAQQVYQLQNEKAQSNGAKVDMVVLGSDTIGECAGTILVKPTDYSDFCAMMQMMSGQSHFVHTAIAIQTQDRLEAMSVTTEVEFARLSEAQIRWYWQSGEPQDKAGGYGIQGLGAQFVKQIKGSYSAVVGLPLYETITLLDKVGIQPHER